jgi:hypothetical protein
MQDFISMATKQLGISEGAAKQGTGALLGMVQQQLGGGDFSKLTSMLPGAQQLMSGGAGASSGASAGGGIAGALGGLLGGNKGGSSGGSGGGLSALASAASGLFGKDAGGLGQIAGLVSQLSSAGIDADKAGGFVKLFMDYIDGKGGGDMVTKLLGNADLKKLIG